MKKWFSGIYCENRTNQNLSNKFISMSALSSISNNIVGYDVYSRSDLVVVSPNRVPLLGRKWKSSVYQASAASSAAVPGITADILNRHYAAISTDSDYHNPAPKLTAAANTDDVITEWQVFKVLDRLRPTATGLDQLPAWYLRLAAPVFAKPLARLFSSSLSTSTVPSQWKQAWIQPVSKVVAPTQPSDYRPISITPILTRVMERMVVTQYIYPSLLAPPAALTFTNQFAFRPTGSTTAAIITILDHVTRMLVDNPYVIVIAIDFTKAFDTVRQVHSLKS
jgi:hypothetical protein